MLHRCQNDITVKPDIGLKVFSCQIRLAEKKPQKFGLSRNRIFTERLEILRPVAGVVRPSGSTPDF